MFKTYTKFFKLMLLSGDLLWLNFSLILASYIKYNGFAFLEERNYNLIILLSNILWLLISEFLNLYKLKQSAGFSESFEGLISTLFFHLLVLTFVMMAFKLYGISRLVLYYTYSFSLLFGSIWRIIFLKIISSLRQLKFTQTNVVILGAGPVGEVLMKFFRSDVSSGYNFLGFFDDNVNTGEGEFKILGKIKDVKSYATINRIDEIYCALPYYAADKVKDIIHFSEENFIRFKIIPDFKRYVTRKVLVEFYGRLPIISLREEPLEELSNRIIKRIFDIIFSLAVIIIIFPPLFLILGILILSDSPGPVIFRQYRWGKKNKKFITYKFRTMVCDSNDMDETGGYRQAKKDDPRITKLGRFLRKTNIDEFPQFWNVLTGEMSVVGPRPHPEPLNEQSVREIYQYSIRHWIKPGITGFAQVKGLRGETNEPEKMLKRVEHDIYYLENWSIWLDILIILQTIVCMFKGDKNAY